MNDNMELEFKKEISSQISPDDDTLKVVNIDDEARNADLASTVLENGDARMLDKSDAKNDNFVDISGKMGLDDFIVNASNYRSLDNIFSDSSSSDSDNDSDDSSSSCSSILSEKGGDADEPTIKKIHVPRTKGELSLKDLPRVEALNVTVPEHELKALGKISSIVGEILVVESFKNSPALDMDSVLFLSNGEAIGSVFETWGPVIEPHYSIRFNSSEELEAKDFTMGETIYYAPRNKDVTSYVFLDTLRNQKGSDASWTDNNEPPIECLDFSDDELEREARQKRRAKSRSVPPMVSEVPKKIAAQMQDTSSQPKSLNVSRKQHSKYNFQNPASQFSGAFIRMVRPHSIAAPNFMLRANHFNPRMHPLPYLQQPRFQVQPPPIMIGWPAKVGPEAVAFQMPNHQMRPPFNAPVQNDLVNVPGLSSPSVNSVSSTHLAASGTSENSANHQGPQPRNSIDPSPISNSASIAAKAPPPFHSVKFATPLSVNIPIMSSALLQHPMNNIPPARASRFACFPPRVPNGTAPMTASSPSFGQLHSNAHNTASASVRLHHHHLGINSSASPVNMNRGNMSMVSRQPLLPQPFVTANGTSTRSVSPGLQYHSQDTVSSSITTGVPGSAPRMPSVMIPPPTFNRPPPPVPIRGWHPFQQPPIRMLPPNNIGRRMLIPPAQNNAALPSSSSGTFPASMATPGVAQSKPGFLLPTVFFGSNSSPRSYSP